MISTGEPSGELYGALLAREVKRKWPDTEIFGIGGSHMELEGIDLIAPISNVIGFTEALKHIAVVRKDLKTAKEALTSRKPDILILIDYPDFNLALAKKARSSGIPILYYVSPQVWAWRKGRVKKIASLVNKIALLFPFEADCYRGTGLPCEFVGHPLTETINISKTKDELKQELGLLPDRPVITLLPGSRPAEISRHFPVIRDIAAKINRNMPEFQIVIPLVQETAISDELMDYITVISGRTREAVASSEVCAVASGTATLEAALLGTPMVVFYKVSPLTFMLGKLLVKVDYFSLVNLLSGKEVVSELIQKEATADNIFSEIIKILNETSYRDNMISSLRKIKDVIGGKRTSERVASMVGEIAGWD
jgi:lipid-A-disaccharide synthase